MKTYTEFVQLNEPVTDINESTIRTAGAAALTLRVRSLNSRLKQIVIHQTDTDSLKTEKLNKKLDLLSDQLLASTYLITQLGVMK